MRPERDRPIGGAFLVAGALSLALAAPAAAQSSWLTGYLQTAPLFSSSALLADSSFSNFNRFRLTSAPVFGPLALEVAYEHAVTFRQSDSLANVGFGGLTAVPSGGEWFDLQGTITPSDSEHVQWVHRLDRLRVAWSPTRDVEFSVGRQAISWGTTLFLTPADPFVPFSPTDPFRVFRGGVDAARLRVSVNALTEVDLVFRPSRTGLGEETTALGRGLTTWRNWELSAWGGSVYGDAAAAVGASGAIGSWAIRFESVVRDYYGTVAGRGTIGLDRLFLFGDRTFQILVEYQRDGRGAAGPDDFLDILESREFQRGGEYQLFGRDEAVAQASFQINPLLNLASMAIWNLNDGSALVAPTFSYSAGDETSIAGGVYFGMGDAEVTSERELPSEYGLAGVTGFLSLTWFF